MKNSIINRQFKYTNGNATLILLAVNAVVYVLCQYSTSLLYSLSMIPVYVAYRHFYWQFFTYLFVHANIWHLVSNMLALFIFGRIVERSVGTWEFLLYYLLCGTLAGVASFVVYWFGGMQMTVLLGASGAVYSLMLLFAVLFPNAVVFLFGIVPIRAPLLVLLYFCIDFFGQFSADGIAHGVHLFGGLFGLLYIIIRMRMNPLKRWGIL